MRDEREQNDRSAPAETVPPRRPGRRAGRSAAGWVSLALAALWLGRADEVRAFPPYRSTDAETAGPFVLEARLGLLRLRRSEASNRYATPLVRLNYGVPGDLELKAEAELDASEGKLGDAGVGVKWVPWLGRLSFGVEALVLLPLDANGGAGVETLAALTAALAPARLHLNAGGSFDTRPAPSEKGWRASALAELRLAGWRPGLELFTRRFTGRGLEVQAGAGAIIGLGPLDLRLGAHAGLTDVAPELELNLWISSAFRTRPGT